MCTRSGINGYRLRHLPPSQSAVNVAGRGWLPELPANILCVNMFRSSYEHELVQIAPLSIGFFGRATFRPDSTLDTDLAEPEPHCAIGGERAP